MISANRPQRLWQSLTVIAVMLTFFAQLTFGSRHLSMTSDEPTGIITGYVILTTGDSWTAILQGHPPLINAWAAWPILLQPERPDPRTVPFWHGDDYGDYVRAMWPLLGPIERLAYITRYPIMLLALVLMALVYRWARDWFGHWGGLLAILVMAWDPTMIAHSQLCTTDLGVTLLGFACLYLLNRLILSPRPSWRHVVRVGLLLGATLGAKNTGIFLVPAVVALLGWGYLRETRSGWLALFKRQTNPSASMLALLRAGGRWTAYTAAILITGLAILWSLYGFEWRAPKGLSYPLPLGTHIRMFQTVLEQKDRETFLWGKYKLGGWWWYFPAAFAIKTPIPLIIALATMFIVLVRCAKRRLWEEMALWIFPLAYVAIAIYGKVNIGYRHLLPAFPFVYVSLGRLANMSFHPRPNWRTVIRWTSFALGVWYIVGTVQVYPFALAYFNEFVGGPRNGYRYLVDSNVDWGQSFKALKTWMDQAGVKRVWLSFYTYIDAAQYGVRYKPLYPSPGSEPLFRGRLEPAPGVYAISATTLQMAMYFPDLYDWFRHQEPTAQPGYGLLVYQVPPRSTTGRWVAQCTVPEAPLNAQITEEGFDRQDLRRVQFDCTNSWIYPDGGHSSGWYAFHRDQWLGGNSFQRQHLAPARLTYQQRWYYDEPPFALFQWTATDSPPSPWVGTLVRVAPSDWAPLRMEATLNPHTAPVQLDGPLTFLGYQLLSDSARQLELATAWRVEDTPTHPLALAARLVTAEGTPVASADGLGVPVDQWHTGDVLIQRHQLRIPDSAPGGAYWLQIGAYWLDTAARWQAILDGKMAGDQLLAAPVVVK